MSDKINIDELLKQELGNLSPEPPAGMWEGINSKVQQLQVATNATAGVAVKSSVLTTKIILAVTAAVTSVAVFVGYQILDSKADETFVENSAGVVQEQKQEIVPESKVIIETEPGKPELKQQIPASDYGKGQTVKSKKANLPADHSKKTEMPDYTDVQETKTDVIPQASQMVKPDIQDVKRNEDEIEVADQIRIEEKPEEKINHPEIPNVFTPNNDNTNDEFIISIENEIVYDLKIVRNETIVFETKDKNVHWKGFNMFNGKQCEDGWYMMTFRYQVKGMKEPKVLIERIQLKRN